MAEIKPVICRVVGHHRPAHIPSGWAIHNAPQPLDGNVTLEQILRGGTS